MNRGIIFMLSVVAVLLMPIALQAQTKPKIKSVELTVPVPSPGMSLFDALEWQLTSAKTEFGDLAATGDISIMEIDWIGDFTEKDDGDMLFRDGFKYRTHIQFLINPESGYDTDYVFTGNDYYIDGSRIKVNVNGMAAKVLDSTPYCINVEVMMAVGGGGAGSEREVAQRKTADYELNKSVYRGSQKAYSVTDADLMCPDTNPYDVITINDSYHPAFYADLPMRSEFAGQKCMLVTRLIVDTSNKDIYLQTASDVNNTIQGTYNIREVWISDKVDAVAFIQTIRGATQGHLEYDSHIYYPYYSMLFHSGRATLFIPESAVAGVNVLFSRPTWDHHVLFTIKTYSGDVYAAQKAGAESARPFCVDHVFTDKIAAADRVCRYETCSGRGQYYYSCRFCGKCEHDDRHTFSQPIPYWAPVHEYDLPLADDQAYIGVNAAGQHVWWYSCIWCGSSYGYDQRHITQAEWKVSGNEATYDQYRKVMASIAAQAESDALLRTTASPGMFALPYKSEAKMSKEFQSSVNLALNDDLLEDAVLGNDYMKPVSHLMLRSLAVRLAEELSGAEIKLDKKQAAYSDGYSAKAAVMGLLEGRFALSETEAKTAQATRQDVAAMLYKTLMYIESAGIYSYSEYNSGLGVYSDRGRIAPWAEDAMAFMDALGLMKGTSATMMEPDAVCSIEKAIDVAERCTHAHQLGWYQARSWGEGSGRSYSGYIYLAPKDGMSTFQFISPGERVWVTGPRVGGMWGFLPVVEPYTKQILYVKAEWFRPVRKHVFSSPRTTFEPLRTKDYEDGVFMWSVQ